LTWGWNYSIIKPRQQRKKKKKMVFKKDGSTHHEGIANELAVIDRLNELALFEDEVTHLGGTGHKADAVAGEVGISIKLKKDARTGSYDYVNTSKVSDFLPADLDDEASDFLDSARARRDEVGDHVETEVREDVKAFTAGVLDALSGEALTDLLRHVADAQEGMEVVVTDQATNTLHTKNADDFEFATLLRDGFTVETVGSAPGSRKTVFVKGDERIDVGVRVRFVLNNGVGALIGRSSANKNSTWTLKVQQDKVTRVLAESGWKVFPLA